YDLEASARFTMLARQIDNEEPPALPVGRPASIIVDEASVPNVSHTPPPQLMPTPIPVSLDPLGPEADTVRLKPSQLAEDRRARTSTLLGVAPRQKPVAEIPAIPPLPAVTVSVSEPVSVAEP